MSHVSFLRVLLITLVCWPGLALATGNALPGQLPPEPALAWQGGHVVHVVWERDPQTPHQRFNVYRAEGGGWNLLTPTPLENTVLLDDAGGATGTRSYRIVALDDRDAETPQTATVTIDVTSADDSSALAEGRALSVDAASAFDKNTIITDAQLTDYNAMTASSIQSFLASYNGPLSKFSSGGNSAAQIIYNACQTYGISPYLVLTTLEKEMSLIRSSSANPDYCAMGWSSCQDPMAIKFVDQIHYGTQQFRMYQNNLSHYTDKNRNPWALNVLRYVSDGTVIVTTTATAGLYVYTPWIGGSTGVGGNYSFWNLWYNVFRFGSSGSVSTDPFVTALANTTQTVAWYYILEPTSGWYIVSPTGEQVLYLDRVDKNTSFGIFWRPVNNASAQGYQPAGKNFASVVVAPDGRSVRIGSALGPLSPVGQALSNTTHPVLWAYVLSPSTGWYIVSPTGQQVLFLDRVDQNIAGGILWKPINNSSFPGYASAGQNYSSVALSSDGRSIFFGSLSVAHSTVAPRALAETRGIASAQGRVHATDLPPGVTLHLTVNSSGNGHVDLNPNQVGYAAGTVVQLTPVPDGGWLFGNWSGDATGTQNPLQLTMDADKTINATFVIAPPACYSLTASASPSAGGTASISTPQNCGGGYTSGTVAAIFASPSSGYQFDHWIATNCALTNANAPSTTCTVSGGGNATVTGTFTPVPPACYSLTANATPSGGGVASVATPQSCAGGYTSGTAAAIFASPSSGYHFDHWIATNCALADANASSTTCTVNSGNATVTATFTAVGPACYPLTTNAIPSGGGTASVATPQSCAGGYTSGTAAAIFASPNSGYHFDHWIATNCALANANASSTTCTVNGGNATVTATFTPVATACYPLTVNSSPSGAGIASVATPQNCIGGYTSGTAAAIFASPNSGYRFSNWIATNCTLANANIPATTCTVNGSGNVAVTATFTAVETNCYSLTANAIPSGGGLAGVSTLQNCAGGFLPGTGVVIFESPNSGYEFSSWIATNCALTNANAWSTTCVITGSGNASVTAIFRAGGAPRRRAAGPEPGSTLTSTISAPANTTPNTWTQISIGIGGTATGPLTFRVWPNCSYTGTDSNIAVAQCGGGFAATAPGTCAGSDNGGWWCSGVTTSWSDHWMVQYASSGTFTPKIIVERSGLSVEARTSISATGTTIASTFSQQGPKLVATDAAGIALQGLSLSLSSDGNTAVVGGWGDNNATGAAWVWTRSGGVWSERAKLTGSGAFGAAAQGTSGSLSDDGATAIVGGILDNGGVGAAWIWTKGNSGVWTQQAKLVGSGASGNSQQGESVALSADGNTAIVGGYLDDNQTGAAWVWTRVGGVWTQQGPKLVGSNGLGLQGRSVSLSNDGNTAIIGGPGAGAWVWTRNAGAWRQEARLVGSNDVGSAQGQSVSLSADGNTAIVGGFLDNGGIGAAWIWTRSGGVWTQQGAKLVGSGAVASPEQGFSASISGDGNKAIFGGVFDNGGAGAAWVWTRSGDIWSQQGAKLIGSGAVGLANQGISVSLSGDGNTAMVGGSFDNDRAGAAWVFTTSR
jgi:hypothetical protein